VQCMTWMNSVWSSQDFRYTDPSPLTDTRNYCLCVTHLMALYLSDFAFWFYAVYVQIRLLLTRRFSSLTLVSSKLHTDGIKAKREVRSMQCNRILKYNIMRCIYLLFKSMERRVTTFMNDKSRETGKEIVVIYFMNCQYRRSWSVFELAIS
jgi:hypothetical protein